MRTAEYHPDGTGLLSHIEYHRPQPGIDLVGISGYLFAFRQVGLDTIQADDQRATLPAHDAAGYYFSLPREKIIVDTAPFRFAYLLYHHLLGRLGSYSAQVFNGHRLVVDHSADLAGFAADLNRYFILFKIGLADSGINCRFQVLKHRFSLDILLPGYPFYHLQQFLVHWPFPCKTNLITTKKADLIAHFQYTSMICIRVRPNRFMHLPPPTAAQFRSEPSGRAKSGFESAASTARNLVCRTGYHCVGSICSPRNKMLHKKGDRIHHI